MAFEGRLCFGVSPQVLPLGNSECARLAELTADVSMCRAQSADRPSVRLGRGLRLRELLRSEANLPRHLHSVGRSALRGPAHTFGSIAATPGSGGVADSSVCLARFGPNGNAQCWDGVYNYDRLGLPKSTEQEDPGERAREEGLCGRRGRAFHKVAMTLNPVPWDRYSSRSHSQ